MRMAYRWFLSQVTIRMTPWYEYQSMMTAFTELNGSQNWPLWYKYYVLTVLCLLGFMVQCKYESTECSQYH